jgi:hypothetical protein
MSILSSPDFDAAHPQSSGVKIEVRWGLTEYGHACLWARVDDGPWRCPTSWRRIVRAAKDALGESPFTQGFFGKARLRETES